MWRFRALLPYPKELVGRIPNKTSKEQTQRRLLSLPVLVSSTEVCLDNRDYATHSSSFLFWHWLKKKFQYLLQKEQIGTAFALSFSVVNFFVDLKQVGFLAKCHLLNHYFFIIFIMYRFYFESAFPVFV